MNTNKTRTLPSKLEAVRRRFELWRQTHEPRSRIPDSLWTLAAKMANGYGLHRTARALRIEYYALKKRAEQSLAAAQGKAEPDPTAAFVELPRVVPAVPCECTLELEDAAGAKMRVHLKAPTTPDLATLSRNFWDRG